MCAASLQLARIHERFTHYARDEITNSFRSALRDELISIKSCALETGMFTGAPNDRLLLNTLKTIFRLSRALLDL